jgi:DNA polymerase III subunit delta'
MLPLPYPPHIEVTDPVKAGFLADRPHHANLWTGPDGVGKYLWALTLARLALKADGPLESHPDFIVLGPEPAALKIEPLRELMAKCAMKPMLAERRVVIVRDAHAMTPQAQNAFLKTLEEPPGQTVFFLLTHQDRKLLRTIRSRCQNVRFAPLDEASLRAIHADKLAALPPETVPTLLAAAAGSAALLGRLIGALEGDDTLSRPLGPLLKAPLRERLAAVEALAESQESTQIGAIRLGQQLTQWARAGNDEQRRRAVQLFGDLQELVLRAEGNGNRKLLWERWLLS